MQKRLVATAHSWLSVRKKTIQQVTETEKNLKNHHYNFNILRGPSSLVLIVVSAAIILSFISPSYTLDMPLIVLAGVGALCMIIALGASIVEKAIENKKLNEVQNQLNDDRLQVEVIQQMAKNIQKSSQATRQVDPAAAINTIEMKVVTSPARTLLEIGAEVLRFGGRAALGLATDSFIFKSRKGPQTQASKKLNKLNVELKKQMLKIKRATQLYNIQRIMYE